MARGRDLPLTDTGQPSTEKDVLKESGDPDLMILAEVGGTLKLLSKDIPQLESASRVPLIVRWNGLVDTGRTSASPNVQNNPRKGGIRECYIPRQGWVYVFVDYDTAELRALAQVCRNLFGYSTLGDMLNAGKDPHLALGATLMGITYDEIVKRKDAGDPDAADYRQFAKIPNFGLPGGMGPDSLVAWAMAQLADKPELRAKMTREFAMELIRGWHATFPEMQEYFDWIKASIGPVGHATITQLFSGRERGGVEYCAACNTLFQGLVADAAKDALWGVMAAAWTDTKSPCYRILRPNLFIHDEIGSEVFYGDPAAAAAAAEEKCRIMIERAQRWMPDQIIRAKPVMCRRWYKGAEPVYQNGILVPSKPVKVNGKTKWVADV
jgi:DNA polymerase I-like protein with 3'-5' exonuclease and polymerase domains